MLRKQWGPQGCRDLLLCRIELVTFDLIFPGWSTGWAWEDIYVGNEDTDAYYELHSATLYNSSLGKTDYSQDSVVFGIPRILEGSISSGFLHEVREKYAIVTDP